MDSLIADLKQHVAGAIHHDPLARGLYATDASPYQIMPRAVVVPASEADIVATLRIARQHGVPITARGGATSLAGQTVGHGIQLDLSTCYNRVLDLNPAQGWVRVQPGIVLDQLNAQLAPHGMRFAPDVSPGNRATIGGMIGNNSSGMYSLRYGKTIDHVLELRILLEDGSIATCRDLDAAALDALVRQPTRYARCAATIRDLAAQHRTEIAQRYPKLLRRVGGYNLDAFVGMQPFNLSRMIVGSEGTLAIVLDATLRIVARPRSTALVLLEFATLTDALDTVPACLACDPAALELMDHLLIDLTRRSLEFRQYLDALQTDAGALLIAEFWGDDQASLHTQIAALVQHPRVRARCTAATPAWSASEQAAVWLVRKAGLPLLQSMSAGLKPETVVEDSAVDPARLSAYVQRFQQIVAAHGTTAAFYGHASVGLLHVRPLLNYKQPADIRKMRSLSEAIRDLTLEFGGAVSGEHGDGLLRSEHNPRIFGPELYAAFQTIKQTFDPDNLLNPGKIVDAPPLDHHLRYIPPHTPVPIRSVFRFRDTGSMLAAAELCNGNGACRKTGTGTMCPSFMATRNEADSTRGRANALRLAIGGVLPETELWNDRMYGVLDLCLGCKACTAECPSGVNLTRLKSEWLQQRYDRRGAPVRSRLLGNIRLINRLGARIAPLANPLLSMALSRIVATRLLDLAARPLPRFHALQPHLRRLARPGTPASSVSDQRTLVLWPDTFTLYNEPQIALDAIALLRSLNYRVLVPRRPICCGRALLSKGFVRQARRLHQRQLRALRPLLDRGLPIVGLEPSCLLTFRDELPDLVDDPDAARLAAGSLLLDEFLVRELDAGRIVAEQFLASTPGTALVHAHCHQQALASIAPTLALLRAAGHRADAINGGCCGMAGSFGYEREHAALSQQIGEQRVLPAIRESASNTLIVAQGTSCRAQIATFTQRQSAHLATVLWNGIAGRSVL